MVPVPPSRNNNPNGTELAQKIAQFRHNKPTVKEISNFSTLDKKNKQENNIISNPHGNTQKNIHNIMKNTQKLTETIMTGKEKIKIKFPIKVEAKTIFNVDNNEHKESNHESIISEESLENLNINKKEELDSVLIDSQDSSLCILKPKSPKISHPEKTRGRFRRRFVAKRSPFSEIVDEGISEYLGNQSYFSNRNKSSITEAADSYNKDKNSRDTAISVGDRTTTSLHKKEPSKQNSTDYPCEQYKKINLQTATIKENSIIQLNSSLESYDSIE